MHDVFISYSSINKNIADNLCHELEQNGIRCWYAPRDILPGKDWREAILNAISGAKLFVLIYTKESNQSRQVLNEVCAAFDASCPILPFRVDDVEMSSALSYYLNSVHWLNTAGMTEKKKISEAVSFVQKLLSDDNTEAATPRAESTKSSPKHRRPLIISVIAVLVIAAIVLTTGFASGWGTKEGGLFSQLFFKKVSVMDSPEAIKEVRKSAVNLIVSMNDTDLFSATGVACIKDNIIVTSAAIFEPEQLRHLEEYFDTDKITPEDLDIRISSAGSNIEITDILLLDYDANIVVLSTSAPHNIPLLTITDNNTLGEGDAMLAISYFDEIGDTVACESSCINNSYMENGIEYISFEGTQDLIYGGSALVDQYGQLTGICVGFVKDSCIYYAITMSEITDRLNAQ